MAKVALVHPLQTFQVSGRTLIEKSDTFADNLSLTSFSYALKSHVSLMVFREFVSALGGRFVTITNDNFRGLSELCDEFRFRELAVALAQFRDSDNFKEGETVKDSEARMGVSELEERMQQCSANSRGDCGRKTRR
jgi:hypothetical protein